MAKRKLKARKPKRSGHGIMLYLPDAHIEALEALRSTPGEPTVTNMIRRALEHWLRHGDAPSLR